MPKAIDAEIMIRDLTAMKRMYDAISLDGMIKALQEAPVIDPMRHGKWGEMYFHDGEQAYVRDCSVCEMPQGIGRHKYCPDCGARMDGD